MTIIAYSAENAALPGGPAPRPLYAGTPESRALREEFLDQAGRINERIAVDAGIDPFAVQPFMNQLGRSLTRYDFPGDRVPDDAASWAAGTSVLFVDASGELFDAFGNRVLYTPGLVPAFNARAVERARRVRTALVRQGYRVDVDAVPVPEVSELVLPEVGEVVDRIVCLAVLIEVARAVWRGKTPDVAGLSDRFDLALVTLTDQEQRLFDAFSRGEGAPAVGAVLDQVAALETLAWCVGLIDVPGDRIGTQHPHPQNLVNPRGILSAKKLLDFGAEELYTAAGFRTLEEICDAHEYAATLDRLALSQREALADGLSVEGALLDEPQVATLRLRNLAFTWLTLPFASWDGLVDRMNRLSD